MSRSSASFFALGLVASIGLSSVFTACGGESTTPAGAASDGAAPPITTNGTTACHTQSDCADLDASQGPNSCFGATNSCGPRRECTVDTDCGSGEICGKLPNGLVACLPPCTTDDDCGPTDACSADGHCTARTCANCPSFLDCSNDSCVARTCSGDAQCPGGYCVDGSCADRLGYCQLACE